MPSNTSPFLMPTGYFSISLGLGATAIAWFHASHLLPFAENIGNVIGIISVMSWLLFSGLYVYKIIRYTEQVKDEWNCPVRFSFIALIPITTMVVGDILYHWQVIFAEPLIWLGAISQLIFAGIRIGGLWKGDVFTEDSTLPPFYLPSVAANFTSASSLALLGYTDLAYVFFGAGVIAWLIFEPVLLQYLRTNKINSAMRGSFGIILAPAFVGVAAYITINGGDVDTFAKMLWGYGFLQLIFLFRLLPWITQNNFSIGLWAFSFGLASMANSAISFYQHTQLEYLSIVVFFFANAMIFLLCLGTLKTIIQGKFWLK
ncbi:dicarboxylate transporter/tellurite-resistance protein TehA [Vespertiliibacter pulmonis]|uniref:Tellurite resistance protein n=1 Tax=Vespertiliibacter pulmonis TaxID=1443036 RepID=A0A3N4VSC5_9PAST|nr:dicarboxylate transporter/tellurite-resistance protein TehA [Vespertiliibacter pulmonis]QLB21502.1 dicarboxylate transporter/tellurite-resistance protein TehA [Vespertiliibacter pulmonis]RPE85918.1 tellurite resistance protein [Vespertiliibacter pulmonis]